MGNQSFLFDGRKKFSLSPEWQPPPAGQGVCLGRALEEEEEEEEGKEEEEEGRVMQGF